MPSRRNGKSRVCVSRMRRCRLHTPCLWRDRRYSLATHDRMVARGRSLKYARGDLLCYRAEMPPELSVRQARDWNPLLEWLRGSNSMPGSTRRGALAISNSPRRRWLRWNPGLNRWTITRSWPPRRPSRFWGLWRSLGLDRCAFGRLASPRRLFALCLGWMRSFSRPRNGAVTAKPRPGPMSFAPI